MSMTREDAIASYEKLYAYMVGDDDAIELDYGEFMELNHYIRSALRPVSREQVEKVWRGNWDVSYDEQNGFTYVTCSKCGDETVLNGCFVTTEGEPCGLEDFCSVCGAPMTDEALEIRLKELEALKDGSTTD